MSFIDIGGIPEFVMAQSGNQWIRLVKSSSNSWGYKDIEVFALSSEKGIQFQIKAESTPVERLAARWKCHLDKDVKVLGDHWERGYGDLEWRGIVPERMMPWYFLMHDGTATHGYGVETGPNSMCFWQTSGSDVTLCMDIRCGGAGVVLNGRKLNAATVISRKGYEGESAFAAARAFCSMMCSKPVLPKAPVYGGNNWYYAYGKSSHKEILEDSGRISDWAASSENRPFMVIDDGWQLAHSDSYNGGPWTKGNEDFHDMKVLADEMKGIGVRPGIWYRPLLISENVPENWCFKPDRFKNGNNDRILDPSIPEVLEYISADILRLKNWGYELIKHDFSTYDIFGRWGFDMGWNITGDGWSFTDRGRTSAEIIKDMYRIISEKAGATLIIGCNTVSHLSAGMFQIQRTGDDTSGMEWERTRKMGVNTLAFRMPQHDTFYAVDADCVGLTNNVPWELNKQWLDLLARSGTPLFISAAPEALGKEQNDSIRKAFEIASKPVKTGEPLDWMYTTCPSRWKLEGENIRYEWNSMERAL